MASFTHALGELLKRSVRDDAPLRALFDHLDLDGNGFVSLEELESVTTSLDHPLSHVEVSRLTAEMDRDGDGQISFLEFRDFIFGLTSFDHHQRMQEFQGAYERLSQVLLEAAGHVAPPEVAPPEVEPREVEPREVAPPEVAPPEVAPPEVEPLVAEDKVLRPATINPCVRKMQYAVRGAVPMMAERIAQEIRMGRSRAFGEVLFCNIGNPQAVGQTPLTFYRQVLALCSYPDLLSNPDAGRLFAADALERARELTTEMEGGTGAYSHSQGLASVRRDVAQFIQRRDGYPADPAEIFLTDGASSGISMVMQVLLGHPADALLIPIPQYPIYSALIELLDGKAVGYHLDEEAGWALTVGELERAVAEARSRGLTPRGIVIINPGNPTGQCFDGETLLDLIRFCRRERLALLADEVYQDNVYSEDKGFVSAKRAVRSLGAQFDDFELVSFHSTSKGLIGECGRRGGYMELCGIDPRVKAEFFKLSCVGLCPNLDGQVMTQLMVSPPLPGDPSYETFTRERNAIFDELKRNASLLVQTLSGLDGVSCQPVEGAMYAFPRLSLPASAVKQAAAQGQSPDMLYCLSLLEQTGICTVPGSGFGQVRGTHHLRMTFLPPEDRLRAALERFSDHHREFISRI
jgi:alanine transaminase